MPVFWKIFQPAIQQLECTPSRKYDRLTIREIQKKMVLACFDYEFAIEAWGLIIVPFVLSLPRIGNITTSTRKCLVQMHSPVLPGSPIYVDTNTCIVSLGELSSIPLTGIRTSKVDTSSNSTKYINFSVTDPCTLLVCWPENSKIPKWLSKRSFFLTIYTVTTTSSTYLVYAKQISVASMVSLGGCGNILSTENYFILISRSFHPSYAKMNSEDSIRFQLSKCSTRLPDIGLIRQDISQFQWNLHLDSNISGVPQMNVLDPSVTMVENIPSALPESLSPLLTRRRLFWEFSARFGTLSIQYSHQQSRLPILYSEARNLCVSGEIIHIHAPNTGVIPRLDHGCTRLELDLLTKCCCCPAIFSEETQLETGMWLSSSLEYILEPTSVVVDIAKHEGHPTLSVKVGCPNHININILPWQLYALYNFISPLQRHLTQKNDSPQIEIRRSKPKITQIVFENKVGQEVHLKVELRNDGSHIEDEEDDRRVFRCSIPSESGVQFRMTKIDELIFQHLLFHLETVGWSPLENISLSSVESQSVYLIEPRHLLSRTNSCCGEDIGDSTWHNSPYESFRNPLSKKLSTLIDEFAAESFHFREKVYGLTVRCKPRPSNSEKLDCENIIDCGLIFEDESLLPDLEKTPFSDYTLHVTLSSNIFIVNSSECSLSLTLEENSDDIELETKDSMPLPLPALHPTNSLLTIQKVWGLDKWLPDPFDFQLSPHSFNIDTPSRLRISRDQENESIWISSLETSRCLGLTSLKSSRPSSLFPAPLEEIEESSEVSLDGESFVNDDCEEVIPRIFFIHI